MYIFVFECHKSYYVCASLDTHGKELDIYVFFFFTLLNYSIFMFIVPLTLSPRRAYIYMPQLNYA